MLHQWKDTRQIVYLPDYQTTAEVLRLGAYFSVVQFNQNGTTYVVDVDNEDMIDRGEITIMMEEED